MPSPQAHRRAQQKAKKKAEMDRVVKELKKRYPKAKQALNNGYKRAEEDQCHTMRLHISKVPYHLMARKPTGTGVSALTRALNNMSVSNARPTMPPKKPNGYASNSSCSSRSSKAGSPRNNGSNNNIYN